MRKYLLSLILLCSLGIVSLRSQILMPIMGGSATAAPPVWANVQFAMLDESNPSAGNYSITVPSTGAGNVLTMFTSTSFAIPLASVSGGCLGAWVVDIAQYGGGATRDGAAHCLSSTSGTTTITFTITTASLRDLYGVYWVETSPGTGTATYEGSASATSSAANPVGPTPTCAGSNELVVQFLSSLTHQATGVSAGYENLTVGGSAANLSGTEAVNKADCTGVTWTAGAYTWSKDALAFKAE